jgi:hypothetical protein
LLLINQVGSIAFDVVPLNGTLFLIILSIKLLTSYCYLAMHTYHRSLRNEYNCDQ